MKHIAIDTNIYVAFKLGSPSVVELFQNVESIGIDITVVAELFSGFSLGNREKKNKTEFNEFVNSSRVEILSHDLQTAEYYALIVKSLKTKGKPTPTNDIWIAASAMRNGLALCTNDNHFLAIDGLPIISCSDTTSKTNTKELQKQGKTH